MELIPYTAVLLYGSGLVSIFIHEFGHVFAAKLVGYKIRAVKVGPLFVTRHNSNWRLSFTKYIFSGFVAAEPPFRQPPVRKEVTVALGGIVANLAGGTAFVILYFSLLSVHEYSLLIICGVLSILVGLVNILPFSEKFGESDGYRLLKLYQSWRDDTNKQNQVDA